MLSYQVFGKEVVRFKVGDEDLYKNSTLLYELEQMFESPIFQNHRVREQIGVVHTTCGCPNIRVCDLPGIDGLIQWLDNKIMECSHIFKTTAIARGFTTPRVWANRMLKDCEGKCHIHEVDVDGVAIFYQNIPTNSGDLVFVRNGITYSSFKDYDDDDLQYQSVKSGDLIIHDRTLPHAITTHESNDPRICFVIEFKYF